MNSVIQILKITKTSQPFSLYIFILLFSLTSILEMFGVAMLIPLIALILDPNFLINLSNSAYSFAIPKLFLTTNYDTLLITICIVIGLSYLLKHLFILFSIYLITHFVGAIKANLTNKLMSNYLAQNYQYHTTKKKFRHEH